MIIFFCLVLYFIPIIISGIRNHKNGMAIAMVNLFTGWTVIGWIIALVWSFTDNVNK